MEGKRLTSYAMEELECPKCGHKHSLKKYKVINVTEKAKLKELEKADIFLIFL